MIGDRLRQRVAVGKALAGPAVLVPAAAEDPGAARMRRGGLADPPDHLLVARGADEVDLVEGRAQPFEVRVGVDQPRGDGAPAELDHLRRRTAQGESAGILAQVDDAAAAHRDAAGEVSRGGHRIQDSMHQDEVGAVLRRGWTAAGEQRPGQGKPDGKL